MTRQHTDIRASARRRSWRLASVFLLAAAVVTRAGAAPAPSPRLEPADATAVLATVRAAGAAGARAVIVNVWATWCAPCREEFPDILRVGRDLKGRGAALVLVSGDFDDSRDEAVKFLAGQGVGFTTYLKTGDDQAFIDGLAKEWSGMFPTTMVFDGTGRLRHLHEGKITYKQLRDLVLDVIDNPKPGPEKERQR